MSQNRVSALHSNLGVAITVLLAGFLSSGPVQAATKTYTLEDVWLLPDISHPGYPAQQMTGTFEWTYVPGDFENGTGEFIEVDIPWFAGDLTELGITFDVSSIEFTLLGNWHDRGLDMTLFLLEPLSPDQPSEIDSVQSIFDIQEGISYQGHVVSGSVVPLPGLNLAITGTCPSNVQFSIDNVTPNGPVAIIYAFGEGSIVVPGGSCSGISLGLNNTAALGAVINADGSGIATYSTSVPAPACGNVFIQALDLSSCETSGVELLQ